MLVSLWLLYNCIGCLWCHWGRGLSTSYYDGNCEHHQWVRACMHACMYVHTCSINACMSVRVLVMCMCMLYSQTSLFQCSASATYIKEVVGFLSCHFYNPTLYNICWIVQVKWIITYSQPFFRYCQPVKERLYSKSIFCIGFQSTEVSD